MLSQATAAASPAFLPEGSIGLVRVAPTWAALSVPGDWGRQVLDVLGDQTGPVFDEPARLHLVWTLPADGASDWPDAKAAQVVRHGHGDLLLVPGPDGYHDGTRWLRSPPARNGHLMQEFIGPSGPVYSSYACPRCWTMTASGGEGRRLRAVHRGPR